MDCLCLFFSSSLFELNCTRITNKRKFFRLQCEIWNQFLLDVVIWSPMVSLLIALSNWKIVLCRLYRFPADNNLHIHSHCPQPHNSQNVLKWEKSRCESAYFVYSNEYIWCSRWKSKFFVTRIWMNIICAICHNLKCKCLICLFAYIHTHIGHLMWIRLNIFE